jgi:hypothetical protein
MSIEMTMITAIAPTAISQLLILTPTIRVLRVSQLMIFVSRTANMTFPAALDNN